MKTTIESNTAIIPHPRSQVFQYLGDFRNFGELMPKDRISDWHATADACTFKIVGMADISMEFTERIPESELRIQSAGKTPISFQMLVKLDAESENSTRAQVVMLSDMNPMIKMMAEKPLQNFLNMLAERMPNLPVQGNA